MNIDNKGIELLEKINNNLNEINNRLEIEDTFAESNKLLEKIENRVENALNQIQNAFDRIHDKVFNFNNILIAAYIALGTFPSDSPKMNLWTAIFPILNLIYLIIIDVRQMEIHRFVAREMEWTEVERTEYGKKITRQTLLSLGALILSLGCLIYLIINLF